MSYTLPLQPIPNSIVSVALPNSNTLTFQLLYNGALNYWTLSIFNPDGSPVRYCKPLIPYQFLFQNNHVLISKYGDFLPYFLDNEQFDKDYKTTDCIGKTLFVDWYSREELLSGGFYKDI